jgi:hypothetical protein
MLRLQTFAALHHREFRLLWAGQATTAMAVWMDQVARGWLMYELTNSPVQLGLVHGVQALPILVLSPLAGSVADRYPRKQRVMVAQGLAEGVEVYMHKKRPRILPEGAPASDEIPHVLCGGAFWVDHQYVRCAYRGGYDPQHVYLLQRARVILPLWRRQACFDGM